MKLRTAAPFLAAAILAIVLAACGTARLSSVAAAHPSAHASASHAVQVLKNNKNVKADEQAAVNCVSNAVTGPHIVADYAAAKACEHKAFPKGGVSNAFRCALHVALTNLRNTAVAIRHKIAVACGAIR